ncbi:MAG: cardiolipin synthase B [Rhizobacter sp.]|nr:cardiolipin synthase B [Burkholderiales bacterium]
MKTAIIAVALTITAVVVSMNFLKPEKQLGRKLEHLYPVADAQFRREMSVMLGPTILEGNSVKALQNGQEIFPAMLAAVRNARTSIAFETYIYWSGDIGRELADALAERAKAGVQVNVLIDWVGALKMDKELLEKIELAGAKVHQFRPLRWYNLVRMNNRTHRKLLVIDGEVAFTGGVGIADQWGGNAESPEHWRDMHFSVRGPVVAQFQAAFNDNWIKATGQVLNGVQHFPKLSTAGDSKAHLFISSPTGGSDSMQLMYLMAIAAAAKQIDVQSAYFVPDELSIKAMLAARARGVKVRLLLPGEHIDSDTVRLASRAQWGPLLEAGVEIYEYLPTMMHSKMLIVDNELVSVGSTNFDLRSFHLNDEASMNVYDRNFASQMTVVFEQDLKYTRPYTYAQWQQRSWTEKFLATVVRPIRSQL